MYWLERRKATEERIETMSRHRRKRSNESGMDNIGGDISNIAFEQGVKKWYLARIGIIGFTA